MSTDADKKKNFLKRYNLKRFNQPVRTNEKGKKGKVGILVNGNPRLIRFGDASMGHSAAYWANKVLWAGPSGSKKSPPSSQKHVKKGTA